GLGEDGPTHQPIEHLASLRAMPNLTLIRPCDANETAEAYKFAMQQKHGPIVLSLTRQAVPTLDRTKYAAASGLTKGGYVLAEGVKARVVSLPSWDLFEKQPQTYRDSVLPPAVTKRVCVEMASVFGWERYAGPTGAIIGMRSFGASSPIKDLVKHFGFTAEN